MLELAIILVVACFAVVVFVGPPYLPTLAPQVKAALDMLDLQPGQMLLELGCGDGKVLVAAAQRGWRVVGIELNPLLVLVCKARTWRYRKQVKVVWGNYWNLRHWPPAEGIFGFVLPKYMPKLDESVQRWRIQVDGRGSSRHRRRGRDDWRDHDSCTHKLASKLTPVRLASFAFEIPGRQVKRKEKGVFLYEY